MASQRDRLVTAAAAVLVVAALTAKPIALRAQQAPALPHHPVPESKEGGVVVMLCDGKTSLEVKGLKPGEPMSRAQALAVSRELMAEWQQKHPGQHWEMAQAEAPAASTEAGAASLATSMGSSQSQGAGESAGQPPKIQQGDTYASFHDRDYKLWQAETQKFVDEGNQIFHSASAMGGTIGISCDMCHPNAANTHPETYPKYQVQLQRVALLRDMISWCIENPVKGQALNPNDERLRALEAYILAQRNGVALAHGKH